MNIQKFEEMLELRREQLLEQHLDKPPEHGEEIDWINGDDHLSEDR